MQQHAAAISTTRPYTLIYARKEPQPDLTGGCAEFSQSRFGTQSKSRVFNHLSYYLTNRNNMVYYLQLSQARIHPCHHDARRPAVPSDFLRRTAPPEFVPFPVIFCIFAHQIEAHPLSLQSLPHSFARIPGCHQERFLQLLNFALFDFLCPNSFRFRTYRRTPRFTVFWPKSSARKPFGINTYKKSRCNPFRFRTYEKGWGVGGYYVH